MHPAAAYFAGLLDGDERVGVPFLDGGNGFADLSSPDDGEYDFDRAFRAVCGELGYTAADRAQPFGEACAEIGPHGPANSASIVSNSSLPPHWDRTTQTWTSEDGTPPLGVRTRNEPAGRLVPLTR